MSIARKIFTLLLICAVAGAAGAAVKINELFYDPTGTDTGKEFLELYNNGTADVDLTGWQVQWGGTTYAYGTWSFPAGTIVHAEDYLLVGGDSTLIQFGVAPDLIAPFTFQNGGNETDAVRIIDAALDYRDTCPYDWPNTYALIGDWGIPADSLECTIDVLSGHSLSRVTVGVDNNLATDWADLATPTPMAQQWSPGGPVNNIADIRPNDSTGFPLYLDSLVTIAGIITCGNQLGTSGPAYMHDNTGAIAVFDNTVNTSGIAVGDSVRVTGWVGFFAGLTEIVDEPFTGVPDVQFTILSGGHTVTPSVVSPSYLTETHEAELIRINNVDFVLSGLFTGNLVHLAVVGTDTFAVYIDAQTNIPGTSIPLGTCDLVGVIGQYDNVSPYFEGYQLIPRSTSDIIYLGAAGPSISQTSANPYLPDLNQPVIINTKIYDDVAVTLAEVLYNPGGAGWSTLQLFDDGLHNDGAAGDSIYGNTIPGQATAMTVNFYIHAQDGASNNTFDPAAAPTTTYYYQHHDYSVITPLSDVHANDSLGVPVMNNQLVTVIGYVTAKAEYGTSGPAYIQSLTTGGYGVGVFDPVIATNSWQIGDQVKVTGWVGFYNGVTEIVDAPNNGNYNPIIQILSTGNVLTPSAINDLDLVGEDDEGLLVSLIGVRFIATGNFVGNTNYWVVNGADTAQVRIDIDTNIPGSPIPTGPVNVAGIMSQFDSSSPYTTGYQHLPRFLTDISVPAQYVTAVPVAPPIIIPATGGTFDYQVDVYNTAGSSTTVQVWLPVELPSGSTYQILTTPLTLTLPTGAHIVRVKTQNVPANAPAGVYSFRIAMGTFPSTITAQDGFAFTKSATGDGEPVNNWESNFLTGDWSVTDPNAPQVSVELLPMEYSLDQNYPNPFNPATTIRFGLPEAQHVKLEIYNLSGQKVATLMDGQRAAGYHEVSFDATGLSSGIYVYRLAAGDFVQMHKLILLK